MSVLKMYFNPKVNQCSPVIGDVQRVVSHLDDGTEVITFVPVDYPAIQRSLGSVDDWSLSALLKAGIDPNFPIHTGNNTRLEGIDVLSQFEAEADAILNENNNNE